MDIVTLERVEKIRRGLNRPEDADIAPVLERWAGDTSVALQRFALERAVRNLPMIEALALLRAAYQCSLSASIELPGFILRDR